MYENSGTFTIHGREYRLDTYYPMGKAQPQYKMFHVWATEESKGITFASEEGFLDWLDKMCGPRQLELL